MVVCACCWFLAVWDSSLGFPGEGPTTMSTLRPYVDSADFRPIIPERLPDTKVEHLFISNSRSILAGDTRAKGLASHLKTGISLEEIESILTQLATQGNSDRPVAARFQSHPETASGLVGNASSLAAESARRGVAHRFTSRPQQWHWNRN